jgi:hypothetical protein
MRPAQYESDAPAEVCVPEAIALEDPLPERIDIPRQSGAAFHPRLIPLWTNSMLSTKIALVAALNAAPDHLTG